ncbi:hypothetical protein GF389_05630 [Candidatus Dojkabacteria bacterium]|nr:hypothetical protein [Candidatus Dojkabacteria bacterium]
MNNDQDKQLPTILSLAALGLVFVTSLAFFSFVFDRAGSEQETQTRIIEKEVEKTYEFSSEGYGIKVEDLLDWEVKSNVLELNEAGAEAVDCRKMSDAMREKLTSGKNSCYEATLIDGDGGGYVKITTGDEFYIDVNEKFIIPDPLTEVREYPSSQVNLPLERIHVSDFPVNFNGTKVSYDSGPSYIYYKGVVYKGADKYALVVSGDLNNDVRRILGQLELE